MRGPMSFIRCLSNPEGMYIWDDVDGKVHVSGNDPGGEPRTILVPRRDFYGVCRKWSDGKLDKNDVAHSGKIAVQDFVAIDKRTGKILSEKEAEKQYKIFQSLEKQCFKFKTEGRDKKAVRQIIDKMDAYNPDRKVVFSVGGKPEFVLWTVTWEHIVQNATWNDRWKYIRKKGKR
jgi:hypothetical protein